MIETIGKFICCVLITFNLYVGSFSLLLVNKFCQQTLAEHPELVSKCLKRNQVDE